MNLGRGIQGTSTVNCSPARAAVEPGGQAQRRRESGQRNDQRPLAAGAFRRARNGQGEQESGERQQQNHQQQVHRMPSATPSATTTSTAPNATQVA